jgi:hypothetical protein
MIYIHVYANPFAFLNLLHDLGLDFFELKLFDPLLILGNLYFINLLCHIHEILVPVVLSLLFKKTSQVLFVELVLTRDGRHPPKLLARDVLTLEAIITFTIKSSFDAIP